MQRVSQMRVMATGGVGVAEGPNRPCEATSYPICRLEGLRRGMRARVCQQCSGRIGRALGHVSAQAHEG